MIIMMSDMILGSQLVLTMAGDKGFAFVFLLVISKSNVHLHVSRPVHF